MHSRQGAQSLVDTNNISAVYKRPSHGCTGKPSSDTRCERLARTIQTGEEDRKQLDKYYDDHDLDHWDKAFLPNSPWTFS